MNYVTPASSPWRFDLGGDVITGTATHAGRWRGVQALGTGATFAAGTAAADLTGSLTGVTIPAGATLQGRFTAIQLSSGVAVAYQ